MAIEIWILILRANRGITFEYILNKMPRAQFGWFVDASTSWGIGGCCGVHYFMIEKSDMIDFFELYTEKSKIEGTSPNVLIPIAYIELLAALFGIVVFSDLCQGRLVRLYSDNTDVISWLQRGRCRAGIGFKILSAIELIKRRDCIKLSPKYIKGKCNTTADCLSRGEIPKWLKERGRKLNPDMPRIFEMITRPINAWREMLKM